MFRFATFIAPARAVWALLALIASRQLGLSAAGYGLLFAALGVGAVIGALCLGWVKQHLSSNGVISVAAIGFALAFGALVLAPTIWVALPLLVVCGFGWTATVSTIISELQLFLPGWVRGRAIAIYLMVFLGSQAIAAPIWGLITQHFGLSVAVLAAAALAGVSAVGGLVLTVPENQHLDRSPVAYWGAATVLLEPDPDAGPIVVSIEYEVTADQEADFLSAMESMRRSRLRSGASRWNLYRVGESPDLFLEQFQVPDLARTPAPARRAPHCRGPGHRGRSLRPHRRIAAHRTPASAGDPADLVIRLLSNDNPTLRCRSELAGLPRRRPRAHPGRDGRVGTRLASVRHRRRRGTASG